MCIALYAQRKTSINKIAKTFGMCWSLVYRWIKEAAENLEEYKIRDDIKEIEFDEMWHFVSKKTQNMDYQSIRYGNKRNDCLGYR